MQWNKRCFYPEPYHEEKERNAGKFRCKSGYAGITSCNKVKCTSHSQQGHHSCKDGNAASLSINQVFSACCKRFCRLCVNYQRICGNCKDLIKYKQREEIG